ncbi:MAG: tautomerase family protein [Anderseniella sp.]
MPIVRITLAAGRSSEQKSALAKDFSQALMFHCGAPAEGINILFEDVELEQWIVGSDAIDEPASDKDGS